LRVLKKIAGRDRIEATIDQLARKGLIVKTQELERIKVSPRLETQIRLAISADEALETIPILERKKATKQAKSAQAADRRTWPHNTYRREKAARPSFYNDTSARPQRTYLHRESQGTKRPTGTPHFRSIIPTHTHPGTGKGLVGD